MTTPCFELTDWLDLLDKAKSDVSRLEKLVNSYDVFNCLCTLNHIPNWIENGEKQNTALIEATEELKKSPKVRAVRELCNLAKHFVLNDPAGTRTPTTDVQKGYGIGRYGHGAYGVGEPSYLVEIDGQMESVLDVLRDVLARWEALAKKFSRRSENPPSRGVGA